MNSTAEIKMRLSLNLSISVSSAKITEEIDQRLQTPRSGKTLLDGLGK